MKKHLHIARHRFVVERLRWPTLADIREAARSKMALAGSVLTILALATMANGMSTATIGDPVIDTASFTVADRADRADRSDRSFARSGVAATADEVAEAATRAIAPEIAAARDAADAQAAREAAELEAAQQAAAQAEAAAAKAAAPPVPVAGLNQTQMNNAKRIVATGQRLGLPVRAYVIAVATAMQECNLYNLASTRLPESYNYPNEGSGSDHDSVGLFQQRPSAGWGAVSQLMDPDYAATAFYTALMRVPGWDSMPLTQAAQRVQVSAYPDAYAKHEGRAQVIVEALLS